MGAAEGGSGRSIFSLLEAETLKIFAAIGEAIEGDKQRAGAVRGEDVREQAVRVVGEVSVSEEAP